VEYAVAMAAPIQSDTESQVRLWVKKQKKENSRLEFGFVLKGRSDATAFNLDLRFSTSGQQPATGQIAFTNIPVFE
jgi:hypothetical protein